MLMPTHDARCVGYFKTQEGQRSGLAELELAEIKPKHKIQYLVKQLKHSCQVHNVEIEHDTSTAISYPFKSNELKIRVWI